MRPNLRPLSTQPFKLASAAFHPHPTSSASFDPTIASVPGSEARWGRRTTQAGPSLRSRLPARQPWWTDPEPTLRYPPTSNFRQSTLRTTPEEYEKKLVWKLHDDLKDNPALIVSIANLPQRMPALRIRNALESEGARIVKVVKPSEGASCATVSVASSSDLEKILRLDGRCLWKELPLQVWSASSGPDPVKDPRSTVGHSVGSLLTMSNLPSFAIDTPARFATWLETRFHGRFAFVLRPRHARKKDTLEFEVRARCQHEEVGIVARSLHGSVVREKMIYVKESPLASLPSPPKSSEAPQACSSRVLLVTGLPSSMSLRACKRLFKELRVQVRTLELHPSSGTAAGPLTASVEVDEPTALKLAVISGKLKIQDTSICFVDFGQIPLPSLARPSRPLSSYPSDGSSAPPTSSDPFEKSIGLPSTSSGSIERMISFSPPPPPPRPSQFTPSLLAPLDPSSPPTPNPETLSSSQGSQPLRFSDFALLPAPLLDLAEHLSQGDARLRGRIEGWLRRTVENGGDVGEFETRRKLRRFVEIRRREAEREKRAGLEDDEASR